MVSGKDLKLLVFDCDGVLFDSKQANVEFYNYILKKAGLPPMTKEDIEFVHMHTVDECINYLFRNHPEKLEEGKKIQKETPFSLFFDYMKMEEGLKEFLEWAKKRFKIALCTNRTTSTQPLLEHFNLAKYFDYIMCALKVPKSDPKALKLILEYFKVSSKETLYVGDSEVDLKLCKACGVPFVAFKNPNLKAEFKVNSYEELKSLIEANFSV
jgi:HAD superfamily hydrolase (TIGR01509 family)